MHDRYYLFDTTLEKRFGKHAYALIRDPLLQMANANDENIFNSAFNNAMTL